MGPRAAPNPGAQARALQSLEASAGTVARLPKSFRPLRAASAAAHLSDEALPVRPVHARFPRRLAEVATRALEDILDVRPIEGLDHALFRLRVRELAQI